MPTAPGGARRVGVALWKGAPTVPWGAGWEAEKGAKYERARLHLSVSRFRPLWACTGIELDVKTKSGTGEWGYEM